MTKGRYLSGYRSKLAIFAAVSLVCLLLFIPLPGAFEAPFVRHALDLGHAPLFAAMTLFVYAWLPGRRRARPVVAFGVSAAAALSVELLQSFVPTRAASLPDLELGIAGAAMASAGIVCWGKAWAWRLAFGVAATLGAAALLQSMVVEWRTVRGFERAFPVLADFEHEWELERWHAKPGTLIARSRTEGRAGEWALEVRGTGREYPGVSIEEFEADWRAYRTLAWDIFLPEPTPLVLTVRIDDDLGHLYGSRFVVEIPVSTGRSTYRIDLRNMAKSIPVHPMNMERITEVHFFLDHPMMPRTFTLDHVRLER